jgi:hypothetical protein
MMDKRNVERLVNAARDYAPVIESILGGLKDSGIRAAIAGAVMARVLDEIALGGATARVRVSREMKGEGRNAKGKEPLLSGTQARIMDLGVEVFFAEPRSPEQVTEELRAKGYHHGRADVNMGLLRLFRKRMLRRIATGKSGRVKTFSYVQP